MEKTLILLKGDAIGRGLVGVILERFERTGLRLEDGRFLRPGLAFWRRHYAELKTRNPTAFKRATRHLAGQPTLALVLAGPNAIEKTRALVGHTDPLKALAGTIRGDFSADGIRLADAEGRSTFNLIHAADSPASARREIALWFGRGTKA